MEITFLGHQGWRFTQGGLQPLLDPIREEIGNGESVYRSGPGGGSTFRRSARSMR
jgi:hypothetical protein